MTPTTLCEYLIALGRSQDEATRIAKWYKDFWDWDLLTGNVKKR